MKKIYPPAYLLMFIIAQTALHYLLPLGRVIQHPYTKIGLLLTAGSLLMVFYLRYIFYHRDTTIKPFAKSDQLITNGIYRISRNPIYIGMVVFLVGTAILFGSATPWIVIPFYPWLINRKFILIEEEMLEKEFGEEYRKYKSRVRRWI